MGSSRSSKCLLKVHGTSNSRVSRNVAYDVSGSAYYLEDGVAACLLEFRDVLG